MSKEIYDKFFREYGPDVHLDPVRFSEIAKLCRGRVLDIGCGSGNLADFYSADYLGVDVSEVAINYAKELRRKDAKFLASDIFDLKNLTGEKFDTIVMAEFLEHIEKDEVLFDMLKNLAKPDARLIVSVPNGDRVPDKNHLRNFTVPQLRRQFSKLGAVKFRRWSGFENRILLTCDLGQENKNLLSLALIAKNEEVGLENAILSCVEFVDNIVIAVDDSSEDKTLEIAKLYADELKMYKWQNSFCQARNFAQEGIKTKWILIIDGHEFVKSVGNLDKALNSDFDSLAVKVILENGFTYYFPRLIRNFVKWQRDVHNYPETKSMTRFDGFIVRHDRGVLQSKEAREARDKQRDEMILNIMGSALKKNKKDIRALFYLAQHYSYQKDFKRSVKFYKKYLKYSKNKQERWLVWWEISSIYLLSGRNFRALMNLRNAEKELPGRWETKFALGIFWGIIGHTDFSLNYFVASLEPNKETYIYNPLRFDEAQTWDFIGAGFFSKNKLYEAKVAWRRALELEEKKNQKDISQQRIEILKRMLKD